MISMIIRFLAFLFFVTSSSALPNEPIQPSSGCPGMQLKWIFGSEVGPRRNTFLNRLYQQQDRDSIFPEWSREKLETLLSKRAAPDRLVLFAEMAETPDDTLRFLSGKLVAFIAIHHLDAADPNATNILNIMYMGTHPELRHRGIGRNIIFGQHGVLYWARKAGVKAVRARVRKLNEPAGQFFSAIGFSMVEIQQRFFKDPVDDAHIYEYNLDQSNPPSVGGMAEYVKITGPTKGTVGKTLFDNMVFDPE